MMYVTTDTLVAGGAASVPSMHVDAFWSENCTAILQQCNTPYSTMQMIVKWTLWQLEAVHLCYCVCRHGSSHLRGMKVEGSQGRLHSPLQSTEYALQAQELSRDNHLQV